MTRCPPGTLCIENITLLFIVMILILLFGFYYSNMYSSSNIIKNVSPIHNNQLFAKPSYSFSNIENDILLNPYEAPTRDNRLFPNSNIYSSRIPINIPTQSFDTNYRQIGILNSIGGNDKMILPLMGRPLITNRDKWNFYTMSDKNNMIKLPIKFNGRNCTADYGCNDLYTGDIVQVDGYDKKFKVTTYENNTFKYIPYI